MSRQEKVMNFNTRKRMKQHDVVVLHQDYDGRGPTPLTVQAIDTISCPSCCAPIGKDCWYMGCDTATMVEKRQIASGVHLSRFKKLMFFFKNLERKKLLQRLGSKQ